MLNKIICWLRGHKWLSLLGAEAKGDYQICKRCGKICIIK